MVGSCIVAKTRSCSTIAALAFLLELWFMRSVSSCVEYILFEIVGGFCQLVLNCGCGDGSRKRRHWRASSRPGQERMRWDCILMGSISTLVDSPRSLWLGTHSRWTLGTPAEVALATLAQMSSAQAEIPRRVSRPNPSTSLGTSGNPKSPSPVTFVARGSSDCDSDSDDEEWRCLCVLWISLVLQGSSLPMSVMCLVSSKSL